MDMLLVVTEGETVEEAILSAYKRRAGYQKPERPSLRNPPGLLDQPV
jgi:hypothetical protein